MNLRPLSQWKLVRMTFFSLRFTFQSKKPTFEAIFMCFHKFSFFSKSKQKARHVILYKQCCHNYFQNFWYFELIFILNFGSCQTKLYVFMGSAGQKNLEEKSFKFDQKLIKFWSNLRHFWLSLGRNYFQAFRLLFCAEKFQKFPSAIQIQF